MGTNGIKKNMVWIILNVSFFQTYVLGQSSSTSYAGHGFGALAGLLIGVFVLVNRKVEDWEVIFKWLAFGSYGILVTVNFFLCGRSVVDHLFSDHLRSIF